MTRRSASSGPMALALADSVEVRVLVDNVTDQLSTNPPHVRSELTSLLRAGMTEWAGASVCCAHFGLSLLVTLYANGRRHRVLFDAGPEGYAIQRNGRLLGIEFGDIEAVVLSHGHWDHGGGLLTALHLIRASNGGEPVPLYVHPGMFGRRAERLTTGEVVLYQSISSPQEFEKAGAALVNGRDPQVLVEGSVFVSGEIPRVTGYERGIPNHLRERDDRSGWEPDPLILDERFLAVHVKDKGVVVFTACSHAGVVNVLTHARELFDGIPLYAVMGGLHLSGPGPEDIIPDTVRDLGAFHLQAIVPCHCTGWRAVTALVTAFGEAVVMPAAVGKVYTF